MINWAHFPQSDKPPLILNEVVSVFQKHAKDIDSEIHEVQVSDEILAKVADSLEEIGFEVERGKKKNQKIHIPVLYGMNGVTEKAFEADGYHKDGRVVIEVEAGRGVTNYQFLKDLFQACMMQDIDYLVITVRNKYKSSKDFEKVFTFFDTLYKSNRLHLPLKGVLLCCWMFYCYREVLESRSEEHLGICEWLFANLDFSTLFLFPSRCFELPIPCDG